MTQSSARARERGVPAGSGSGLLYFLFFCSGLSGLIYQVAWVREFGNVFGNTVYSASLVVAVYGNATPLIVVSNVSPGCTPVPPIVAVHRGGEKASAS